MTSNAQFWFVKCQKYCLKNCVEGLTQTDTWQLKLPQLGTKWTGLECSLLAAASQNQ